MVVLRTTRLRFQVVPRGRSSFKVCCCPYLEKGFGITVILLLYLNLVSLAYRFMVVLRTTASLCLVVRQLFWLSRACAPTTKISNAGYYSSPCQCYLAKYTISKKVACTVHTTILHKPENAKCLHKWRIRLYCTDTANYYRSPSTSLYFEGGKIGGVTKISNEHDSGF